MRDLTNNEVGGFGITDANDLLLVTDFVLVKQEVSVASVSFEDGSVANFFEDMVEAGKHPQQFSRIWLHTHPGDSPQPSGTDESTFERVFGSCDWSVMAIVAKNNNTFARLRFNAGPGGETSIPVCIDYGCKYDATNFDEWKRQYTAMVTEDHIFKVTGKSKKRKPSATPEYFGDNGFGNLASLTSSELLAEIDTMDSLEREYFMEELAVRSNYWDGYGSEMIYE